MSASKRKAPIADRTETVIHRRDGSIELMGTSAALVYSIARTSKVSVKAAMRVLFGWNAYKEARSHVAQAKANGRAVSPRILRWVENEEARFQADANDRDLVLTITMERKRRRKK